jgi:hypothetical protein
MTCRCSIGSAKRPADFLARSFKAFLPKADKELKTMQQADPKQIASQAARSKDGEAV